MSKDKFRYSEAVTASVISEENSFFDNLRWLNSKEAAQYLRLGSVGVLRNMVSQRKIPFYKLGRSLRFKVTDLDQILESSKNDWRFV